MGATFDRENQQYARVRMDPGIETRECFCQSVRPKE